MAPDAVSHVDGYAAAGSGRMGGIDAVGYPYESNIITSGR